MADSPARHFGLNNTKYYRKHPSYYIQPCIIGSEWFPTDLNNYTQQDNNDEWLATHYINPNPTPKEIANRKRWIANHNRIVANNLKKGIDPNDYNNEHDLWLATHYINPNPSRGELASHKRWVTKHNEDVRRNLSKY